MSCNIQEITPNGDTKMIKGKGKIVNRPSYSKKKEYPKYFIYIPIEVFRDSAFPLQTGENVTIRIDPENKRLIIEETEDKTEK